MDLAELRKLIRLMEKAELSELEIDDSKEGLRVHLKRAIDGPPEGAPAPLVQMLSPAQGHEPAPVAATAAESGAGAASPAGTELLKSPMVGTFYRAASPDADAFVDVGSRVDADSVVCIVEAMKVMNEIRAELVGEVVEVLVENGEPVEFGQALFLIKKG